MQAKMVTILKDKLHGYFSYHMYPHLKKNIISNLNTNFS